MNTKRYTACNISLDSCDWLNETYAVYGSFSILFTLEVRSPSHLNFKQGETPKFYKVFFFSFLFFLLVCFLIETFIKITICHVGKGKSAFFFFIVLDYFLFLFFSNFLFPKIISIFAIEKQCYISSYRNSYGNKSQWKISTSYPKALGLEIQPIDQQTKDTRKGFGTCIGNPLVSCFNSNSARIPTNVTIDDFS